MSIKIKKRNTAKLYIAVIVIGIIICLFYRIGYVPIIGNKIAEKKLSAYSSALRGKVSKVETKYNWYDNIYQSNFDKDYILNYSLKSNIIYDETLNQQINLEAKNQYNTIKSDFSQNMSFPNGILVYTGLNGNDYSIKYQRLYLLGIYNNENISEEESGKMPAAIAQEFIKLMGENYNFTGIQLIYCDKNGGYTIEIPADTFNKLEYKDMLDKTRKMKEKELGEEYFQWLSNNNLTN